MESHDPFADYRAQIVEAIRHAEVVSLFFPRIGKSLIIDMRPAADGPAVLLDDMATSPAARLKSFERLRPHLPSPERLTVAAWHGDVRGLETTGVLTALIERCQREGGHDVAERAQALYRCLLWLEDGSFRNLIRGIGMQTIWRRPQEDRA